MSVYATRMKTSRVEKTSGHPLMTVVVAVRNEENNIEVLLAQLAHQSYPSYEVIVVDDHSEDETARIVETFNRAASGFSLLKNAGVGKKQALATGVRAARGEIIVTTDADCTVPLTWLHALHIYFQNDRCQLAFGGVRLAQENFFHAMQAIEFSSLIGAGAVSATLGFPTMCNGANLAFRKKAFFDVNGYEGNEHIPSGDDEFLMRKIRERYPHGIFYVSGEQAIVTTTPMDSLRDFIAQRLRWAGKWKHNTSVYTVLLAMYVFVVQATSIFCLAWGLWNDRLRPWAMAFLMVRAVSDWIFLRRVTRYLKVRWNGAAFLVLQIMYPFYVVAIGLCAQVMSHRWKGR
jgi:cellulose synthase/poly-beta-1,6-N-acetylglucosamine synthase-like glycosyltransferase